MELIRSKWVAANYFPLLDIEPIHGRGFTPEESLPGGDDVAMVTEAFWDRAFGSSPETVGASFDIGGEPHTVVGILPDRMGPLDRVESFPALGVETPPRKGPFFFLTLGRIREGVAPAVAQQQLDAVATGSFRSGGSRSPWRTRRSASST